ncbi:MAG: ABC transporter substrate binding protein [Thermodesulfobacteriota bacterium]
MERRICLVLIAVVWMGLAVGALESIAAEKTIGLMWTTKSGIAKRTAVAFIERMREIAPDVKVIERSQLPAGVDVEQVFKDLEGSTDAVVFLRSMGAQFLAKAPLKGPAFIGACNNPQELGVIKNLASPEGNITGVTYFVPYEQRFEAIRSLFPRVKSLALALERGHPVAPLEQSGTREQCLRLGIAYHEVQASTAKELDAEMEKVADKVDLFVAGATRLAIDNITVQTTVANRHNKPIFSYTDGRTKLGATAELAANDLKLGRMLAESVVDVVVKGRPVREVPVKMDPQPELVINETMVKILGLDIPAEIMKKATIVK